MSAPLRDKIADPFWGAENPLYVVGRTGEKRSHYVKADRHWAHATSLCGQAASEGAAVPWNARTSMQNLCNACHAEACRMPCVVKKVPDDFFNRPWIKGTAGYR